MISSPLRRPGSAPLSGNASSPAAGGHGERPADLIHLGDSEFGHQLGQEDLVRRRISARPRKDVVGIPSACLSPPRSASGAERPSRAFRPHRRASDYVIASQDQNRPGLFAGRLIPPDLTAPHAQRYFSQEKPAFSSSSVMWRTPAKLAR